MVLCSIVSMKESMPLLISLFKDDTLIFSATGFSEDLVAGAVSNHIFNLGTAATSEQHRFIYDGSSVYLFYDSDGTGDNEQVRIALLDSGLNLGNEKSIETAYEAGFSGFVLHRILEKAGINNIVVNPGSIEVAVHNRVKTDKTDAVKIATLLETTY